MKKNKSSKDWLVKKHRDQFFKKSQSSGYRSRSAYKLIEMDKKFKFLKSSTNLLDIGCFPGGWSQVAVKKISKGKILAIDNKLMKEIDKVCFLHNSIFDQNVRKKIDTYFNDKIDVVLSDMAANTTGNKDLDANKTGELCLKAMDISLKILKEDGVFISKIFMGSIFSEIDKKCKKNFKKVIKYKPLASKQESREIYIYCKGIANPSIF